MSRRSRPGSCFRPAWALGLTVAMLLGSALPASGHTRLVASVPADGSFVPWTPSPIRVELRFSDPMRAAVSLATARSATDTPLAAEGGVLPHDHRRIVLEVSVPHPGPFTVEYRVTAEDGHAARGRLELFAAETEPVHGAAVRAAPALVRVAFGEELRPGLNRMELERTPAAGVAVAEPQRLPLVDSSGPLTDLRATVATLDPGEYRVHWTAVLRRGRVSRGTFDFTVAAESLASGPDR